MPDSAACIRCGGTEDLMDRGMAPGMTYCAPCRKAMREGNAGPDERIIQTAEPNLWGRSIKTTTGVLVRFEPIADDGSAPVREPRRPKPAPPSLQAEATP